MTMSETLPTLHGDEISPEEPEVPFWKFECRDCGDRSDWMRESENGSHYAWQAHHTEKKGTHKRFYEWIVTRRTANVISFGA
jgi:hypothetical protein